VRVGRCGASDDQRDWIFDAYEADVQDELIGDAYPDAPSGSKPSCPRNSI
jgi:hypothetical protein